MTPYYDDGQCVIYHEDCNDVLPTLPATTFILTDPPYGINYKSSRGETVEGDNTPFDPYSLLNYGFAGHIIFGANHFHPYPPLEAGHGLIIWDKRDQVSRNLPGSDAEVAWTDATTQVRIFRHIWIPHTLRDEPRYHPTQKPTRLCRMLLSEFTTPTTTICDPYMGSGTTLRAAKDLGRKAIGIETQERYCEIAAQRLAQGVLDFGASA